MSDSVQPHRWQPTRLPHPWDSPSKNTGVGCHLLLQCMKVKSESEFAQLCLTLREPMDCSLPGSSIHGIFQARVLEWVAIAFCNLWLCGLQQTIENSLKEMGVPDHLTHLLRNLYVGQETTELEMGQLNDSKLGKEYDKILHCHPAYFTSMQVISCKMSGWMNHKLKSRMLEEILQPQICKWYHSNGRNWRRTK